MFHALRVMLRFADPVDQTAAVLHDVVEDTEITLDDLRDAGVNADPKQQRAPVENGSTLSGTYFEAGASSTGWLDRLTAD